MSFAGDLHTFDLFDLLGWLMSRKKAGVLQMTRRSTKKRLAFRDGAVQWTSSNDPRETIGQALVRDGLITEEALFSALLKQETDKRRLGELLISDGHLSEPQLMKTLRTNAEAHLHDLFLWGSGRFEFDDERPPGSHRVEQLDRQDDVHVFDRRMRDDKHGRLAQHLAEPLVRAVVQESQ